MQLPPEIFRCFLRTKWEVRPAARWKVWCACLTKWCATVCLSFCLWPTPPLTGGLIAQVRSMTSAHWLAVIPTQSLIRPLLTELMHVALPVCSNETDSSCSNYSQSTLLCLLCIQFPERNLCDQCRVLIFANYSIFISEMSQKSIRVEQIYHSHLSVWTNLVALYTYKYEW